MKLPHIVNYNTRPKMGGEANLFVVNIRPEYKNDVGLHVHEYTHVVQWYICLALTLLLALISLLSPATTPLSILLAIISPATHSLLYSLVPKYRLKCEVSAYRKQLARYPTNTSNEFAIEALTTKYNLKISREEAVRLLK